VRAPTGRRQGGRRAGRPPDRSLGQHFLRSAALAARIVDDAAIVADDVVVEIGPGHGALTLELARRAAMVLALELDADLASRLAGATPRNVVVLHADGTRWPLPRSRFRVLANPPFGATSALLRSLLDDVGSGLWRADLVVQWQVARQRARAGGECVDLVGTTWAPWWTFRRGRRLPASVFRPAPSVDAAVLVMERRARPLLDAPEWACWRAFVRDEFAAGRHQPEPIARRIDRFRESGGRPARR